MSTFPRHLTTAEMADRLQAEYFGPDSPSTIDALSDSPHVRAMFSAFHTAFPDATFTPFWRVVDGAKAVFGGLLTGTHLGPWLDVPASGARVEALSTMMIECAEGRIVDLMVVSDSLSIAVQIGVLAPLGPKVCEVVGTEQAERPFDPQRTKWC